jgi:hypothetical protein
MGALAHLSQTTVDVEPGRTVVFGMTVRNTGTVVDRFSFEALGTGAPWVTFAPTTLSLFPEASGTVNVVLAPPRDPTVLAGATALGLRVASSEDPAGSVVEEATVNIGAFSDITLELIPRVTRGRIMGRAQLAVDNRSNCTYRAELSGSDPQGQLGFSFRPPIVDVAAGMADFVKVGIRPSRRFWKGHEKTVPFRLTLTNDPVAIPSKGPKPAPASDGAPEGGASPAGGGVAGGAGAGGGVAGGAGAGGAGAGGAGAGGAGASGGAAGPSRPADATPPSGTAPATATAVAPARPPSPHQDEIFAEGSLLQGPLLPRWLLWLAGAIVALAALLVILWFALFRPQIRSTAQNEVNKQLAANGITPVSTSGGGKSSRSGGGGSSGGGSGGGSTATTVNNGGGGAGSSVVSSGTTINGEQRASGNGTTVIFTVPNGRSLQITDLLVENSAGDAGNLVLARNGTPVLQWAMANFRDLDYHWITPIVLEPKTQVQMIVSGCTGACTPAIYYAGHLVPS